jgi:DNA-binding NtrC family response regulator/tetratricopeptide (TPR) repeat protein
MESARLRGPDEAMNALADMTGECNAMTALRKRVADFLRRQATVSRQPPVLIEGETGTGKGLLARVLHRAGLRASGPFVSVNCAAIPETLLEAELFGYERGAFTGARQGKAGLIQTAHGGVLFLDEIGLLPLSLQSKLLTALEDGAIRRLGSTRNEPVNAWILAASNENLTEAVRLKTFREDLYHRLAVMTFTLPPLRERGRDVIVLAERFLEHFCLHYGVPQKSFSDAALETLEAYPWPGNIRELSNIVERVVLASDLPVVVPEVLQLGPTVLPAKGALAPAGLSNAPPTLQEMLLDALTRTNWNISRTAELLGLTRNTVRARIERFGLRSGASTAHLAAVQSRASSDPRSAAEAPDPASWRAEPGPSPRVSPRWDERRIALLRVELADARKTQPMPGELSRQLNVVIDKVHNFGGTVREVSFDGLEACFGLDPIEDPSRSAAHAALATQRELLDQREGEGGAWCRIVIHTCQVFVAYARTTPQIDGRSLRQILPTIEAILATAEAGEIVVTSTAAAFLRRRFALEPAGRAGSGLTLYRLVSREQFSIADGEKATRFVGRHQDLALLQNRLNLVLAGRGQIAVVVGDPGIGKSRLVWEFTRSSEARATRLLETGSAYASITPSLSVVELMRRYFSIGPADDPDGLQARVHAAVCALDASLEPIVPALLSLLGVLDAEWSALQPIERRHRTLEAVKRLLIAESRVQPLSIVFEDVHWIDSESQAFLDALVGALPTARVLLVVTYRPEYRHGWTHLSYYTQLNLAPLLIEPAHELLESLLGTDTSLDPLKRHLVERTGGHPLFLEESVQSLIETGAIEGTRGDCRVVEFTPMTDVPATIQDILAARIDRLGPEERSVLQSAATIGAEVPVALLAAVACLQPESLSTALRQLQSAELLYENSTTDATGFVFKHALTRDVAYHSLPSDARRELHRRIVSVGEASGVASGPERVDSLARHAFHGELWIKALRYAKRAGDQAMESAAVLEATEYFGMALSASKHLPDAREALEDVVDLRLRMRDAMWPQLRFSSLLENLRAADVIAESLADQRRQGWIACYLVHYFWSVGDLEQAGVAAKRGLTIAHTISNRAMIAETNFYLGLVQKAAGSFLEAVGTLSAALRDLEDAIRRPDSDFPSRRFAVNGSVIVRSFLMRALSQVGRFAEAVAWGQEAMRSAKDSGNPFGQVAAAGGLGAVYVRQNDPLKAIEVLEPALHVCRAYRLSNWVPTVGGSLGLAYAQCGRLEEGLAILQESVQYRHRFGLHASASVWQIHLGTAYLLAGQRADAMSTAAQVLTECQMRHERGYEALALALLGEIEGTGDSTRLEAAMAAYEGAMSAARHCDMHPLIARCHFGLSTVYQRMGEQSAAHEQRDMALAAFHALGMQPPTP